MVYCISLNSFTDGFQVASTWKACALGLRLLHVLFYTDQEKDLIKRFIQISSIYVFKV